jgi:hypothetical protein
VPWELTPEKVLVDVQKCCELLVIDIEELMVSLSL